MKYDDPVTAAPTDEALERRIREMQAGYTYFFDHMFSWLDPAQEQCYAESAAKGWHPNDAAPGTEAEIDQISGRLECLHEELSELWSAIRSNALRSPCDKAAKMKALGLPELTNGEEEIADIIIRTLDLAQTHGISARKAVSCKLMYNRSRPHRHGGKTR